ncbi:hypothetical protein P7H62_10915 [Vagococcus carniphilus]|uniref:Uncharacterized protein n=1 Tax=Vagococcus carniphilus TaxID=218144 RepID=A0AAW8U1Q4_9ENTE|nr:hypothetical protein [Vagococcus carniphilus]MDT2831489.1 hypothetical protein [Vagococcus carniphilus]MDT2832711.1 hypothetical protein [Vagococcus carniphilus]MDT2840211.1 hypothetical protein [Vagococcus carniphilus]MDT2854966.1 hypothetical protein [Vagococcus carniphilus]
MKVKMLTVLLFISLFLISCSNKNELEKAADKRNVSSEIDAKLVENVVGEWVGDTTGNYPIYGKFTITEKNQFLFFDDKKLQITKTVDDIVFTQTEEEKPFYYDFKVIDKKLTVYPSYSTRKGFTGGLLAPMELIKDGK